MNLSANHWAPITYHEMVAAFLQAERHRFKIENYRKSGEEGLYDHDMALIDQPNLADHNANHRRLRLLNLIRAPLLGEIPPDTVWYKVSNLRTENLDQLHFIARCGWDDADGADDNKITIAAHRIQKHEPRTIRALPSSWPPPILWGHDKDQPLTIMEGNNRLMSYVVTDNKPPLDITAIVGLSPTPCFHHYFDPAHMLVDDLYGLPPESERPAARSLKSPSP